MRNIFFREAVREAMQQEMKQDPTVFLVGQDVGLYGGAFRVTEGMYEEFGENRVIDAPISEAAMVGAGIGAAMVGMRPIIEIQYADFLTIPMDQLVNNAAKMNYLYGGELSVPLVVRAAFGAGRYSGPHHSQSPEAWFLNVPGLKLIMPSTPYDAKGLLIAAIRDPDPCIFFECKLLYSTKGDVPEEPYELPIGVADIKRPGKDITIVATGLMLYRALQASKQLEASGISAEIIDPRTLVPLDVEAIVKSVRKTARLMVVHEAPKTGGFGAEIAAVVGEEAFGYLDAPIKRLTGADTPVPFSPPLEDKYLPDIKDIVKAAVELCSF